ncbi:MAG: DNA mismatch repair endonuclease MutL [Eubacteriales bacterium]|uniref:DNA mismatch repair endonuclease MutL n=1 Tax=Fenollaria sp. TaxID=1965292 RepID=UPI002A74EA9A|nr:DNA mismatch repair endonuclease MutL [Fenollaria sp.]MDD7339237.1 DNA mismatch repair endonuclease MutL [Eubacteriales bacterium]MDY3106233.1 DNA mismatch repair endonuclease MutL [Fenollaria sp.]
MIKVLSKETVEKIAAGEVIERPVSVVKELVENSIDAGATNIIIKIYDGGKRKISISDNGSGINREDVNLAFIKHSTSKIENVDDLYRIHTMGFRGEALASIKAISNVTLISKTEDEEIGSKISFFNGNKRIENISTNKGTSIIVEDIFYNIPARKKFLKKDTYESNLINDLLYRLAIANPSIGFKYMNNDKLIFDLFSNQSLYERINSLYGYDTAINMKEVNIESDKFKIIGYISNNLLYRSNKKNQLLYINNRTVKNDAISKVINEAYKSTIPLNRFPVFFLFIDIDPSMLDVNIHPAKTEVKIQDMDELLILLNSNLKRVINSDVELKIAFSDKKDEREDETKLNIVEKDEEDSDEAVRITYEDDTSTQDNSVYAKSNDTEYDEFISKEDSDRDENNEDIPVFDDDEFINDINLLQDRNKDVKKSSQEYEEILIFDERTEDDKNRIVMDDINILDAYKIEGVLFNTFILLYDYNNDFVVMIDQHAAHERILYEEFSEKFKNSKVNSQYIEGLSPIKLTVNEEETIKENMDLLNKFGFTIDIYPDHNVVVRSIPIIFGGNYSLDLIKDIIGILDEEKTNIYDYKVEKIMKYACKNAIKAGDKISNIEIDKLIEDLKKCKYPTTCPHGRPSMIILKKNMIEKMFFRIQ